MTIPKLVLTTIPKGHAKPTMATTQTTPELLTPTQSLVRLTKKEPPIVPTTAPKAIPTKPTLTDPVPVAALGPGQVTAIVTMGVMLPILTTLDRLPAAMGSAAIMVTYQELLTTTTTPCLSLNAIALSPTKGLPLRAQAATSVADGPVVVPTALASLSATMATSTTVALWMAVEPLVRLAAMTIIVATRMTTTGTVPIIATAVPRTKTATEPTTSFPQGPTLTILMTIPQALKIAKPRTIQLQAAGTSLTSQP